MKNLVANLYTKSSMEAQIYLECWMDSLKRMESDLDSEFEDYSGIEEESLYYEQLYLNAVKDRNKYSKIIRRLGLI